VKKVFLRIWQVLPKWLQKIGVAILMPHYLVIAIAVVFNERDQILLCRHTYRRPHPWGLPGGHIKSGEDPADSVRRELWEETGLSVQGTRLLMAENLSQERRILLTYLCKQVGGTFIPNEEVSMIQYFDIGELPALPTEELVTIEKVLTILKTEEG